LGKEFKNTFKTGLLLVTMNDLRAVGLQPGESTQVNTPHP